MNWGRPRRWTVQQRMLVLTVALMGLALSVTGAVSYALEYRAVSAQTQDGLLFTVDSLRRQATSGPAHDGRPFADLDQLFFEFMGSSALGEDEASVALIDGEPVYVSGGTRTFDAVDPAVLQAVRELRVPAGRARRTTMHIQGTDLEVVAADVRLTGDPRTGTFVVAADFGARREAVTRHGLTFAALAAAAMLTSALLAHLLTSRLLRPLRELRAATGEISTDDLTRRVEVTDASTDVAELAVRFNAMLDRIEAGVRQQRQFLADATHELRTPLTILRGNIELADQDDPHDAAATRDLLLDEIDRMQRLVDDLLDLARSQRPDFLRPEEVDVAELAVETMDRISTLGPRTWRLHADAEGSLRLDRQRVLQALVQLAANAVRFSRENSTVELTSAWRQGESAVAVATGAGARQAERYLTLAVRDEGVGVRPEQQERIFERFVQDGQVRSDGSGLGLAIVRAIVEAHGGAVTVDSTPGAGATFTIWLPDRTSTAPR